MAIEAVSSETTALSEADKEDIGEMNGRVVAHSKDLDDCLRTVDEFKKHVKDQGKDFSDVRFYNWAEEIEKNREDLITKGIILEADESSRHYNENPHYTRNPHYTKPLC